MCAPVGDYAAATAAGKPENFSQNKKDSLAICDHICYSVLNTGGLDMSKESDARKKALNGGTAKTSYQQKKQAIARYNAKFSEIKFRVPKGEREKWKEFAAQNDTSLQQLIIGMMHDAMDKAGFDYSVDSNE